MLAQSLMLTGLSLSNYGNYLLHGNQRARLTDVVGVMCSTRRVVYQIFASQFSTSQQPEDARGGCTSFQDLRKALLAVSSATRLLWGPVLRFPVACLASLRFGDTLESVLDL